MSEQAPPTISRAELDRMFAPDATPVDRCARALAQAIVETSPGAYSAILALRAVVTIVEAEAIGRSRQ